jgi:hypothetical protein
MQDRGKDSFVSFGYSPIEVVGGMAPLPELVGADVGDFDVHRHKATTPEK